MLSFEASGIRYHKLWQFLLNYLNRYDPYKRKDEKNNFDVQN